MTVSTISVFALAAQSQCHVIPQCEENHLYRFALVGLLPSRLRPTSWLGLSLEIDDLT